MTRTTLEWVAVSSLSRALNHAAPCLTTLAGCVAQSVPSQSHYTQSSRVLSRPNSILFLILTV